jgi:hypothetical protein
MEAKLMSSLENNTGKPIEEWVALARASGLTKHREILNYMKDEHGLTYGYANSIATKALQVDGQAPPTPEKLVDAQYSGAKQALLPIYGAITAGVSELGEDVELSPKKSYVSLRRSKQFGIVQPSTKTRVDVGIKLMGVEPSDRLEASGSFSGMVTHRVRVTDVADVDAELIEWLKQAYEAA